MEQEIYNIIGGNILSMLKKKKMTQVSFAKKIKKSTVYLNNVIRGRGKPSLDALAKMCEVLEIQPHELLLRQEDKERSRNTLHTEYAGTHIQMASIAEELVDILLKKKLIAEKDLSSFARDMMRRRKMIKKMIMESI